MKKKILSITLMASLFVLFSCGGGEETAESIAKKMCKLDKEADNIADKTKREAAREKLMKYEKEIEEKYKDDQNFLEHMWDLYTDCSGKSH